jgi:eukaryotic-like serine/threonine-protein kinase
VDSLDTLVPARADTLVLGRYRLLERLGAGGFGVVWSAHDERLGREVALKRIFLPTEDDDSVAERAAREAQATARLSHPAIVALYEARREGEAFYLVSELVQGDTLATLIAEDALADEEILRIGVAISSALEHAHARGVIHRDVKPQNILVPEEPSEQAPAKLTDFGGARLAGEDVLTRTGDVLGTLAYMAPEQCEGRGATAQADLYSLALVLYEALSGVNPVRGATPTATARRIGTVLTPLERHRPDLPPALTRTLDAAMSPAPSHRGTLPELREALEEAPARDPLPRRRIVRAPVHVQIESALARGPENPVRHEAPRAEDEEPARRLLIPRAVWATASVAIAVWQAAAGRPGVSLLVIAAALPLLIAPRLPPLALGAAAAPALGVVGLAGVYPALAGQGARWFTRAGMGALGYWWLCLAEPLVGRRLWLGLPGGWAFAAGAHGRWEGSFSGAFEHVLLGMLTLGVLVGVALWAAGALLLPWLVRGRNALLDVVAATVWSAAMLAALPLLERALPGAGVHPPPRGALLAGLLGGALAVVARALRGPV